MQATRVAIGLSALNGILLVGLLSQMHVVSAQTTAPMIRGRGLEIVDGQGIVRAQIVVNPDTTNAQHQRMPGGVLLRLIDTDGKPLVKLGASAADGAGLMLSGDSGQADWHGIQLLAKPADSRIHLLNANKHERTIKP